MKKIGLLVCLMAVLFFAKPSLASLPSPTITIKDLSVFSKPVITGQTTPNTKVEVYLDGVFSGYAKVSDTSFSFTPPALNPGTHIVYAVSVIGKEKSFQSEIVRFVIPYKAPILFSPLVNSTTTKSRPYIIGVGPSDAFIDIYINGEKDGSLKTRKDPSGSASFSYLPLVDFTQGTKEIVAKWVKGDMVLSESIPVLYYTDASLNAPTIWYSKGLVRGITKSESTIQIFVNNKLDGEFLTDKDVLGVTTFAYHIKQPSKNMVIRARATSQDFQISPFSPEVLVKPIPVTKPVVLEKKTITIVPEEPITPEPIEVPVKNQAVPLPKLNEIDQEQRNKSVWILTVLTIIVLVFIGWFVWANREFFMQNKEK